MELLPAPVALLTSVGFESGVSTGDRCLCPSPAICLHKRDQVWLMESGRGTCRVPPAQGTSKSLSRAEEMALLSCGEENPPVAGVCLPAPGWERALGSPCSAGEGDVQQNCSPGWLPEGLH